MKQSNLILLTALTISPLAPSYIHTAKTKAYFSKENPPP